MRYPAIACFVVGLVTAIQSAAADPADVAKLTAGLGSATPAERYAAADGLADLGPAAQAAVAQLTTALGANDAELRWRAARALGVIGDAAALPALRKAAGDSQAIVRAQAIFALGRLRAADKPSLDVIVTQLADQDSNVRRASVRALAMIKADRKVTIPLVVKLLQDADPAVATRALNSIAEGGAEVISALTEALDHKEARYWACLALSELGPKAKDAVPALTKVLADERPEVRLQAAIALAEIGPEAKSAVPELVKSLNDKFESVRNAALFALGRIGDKSAADVIAKLAKSSDAAGQVLAAWTLARLSPGDKQRLQDAVGLLVGKLGDKDRNVAHMAARGLAELEPSADIIRPAMEKVMAGADAETADRIFSAYASLGPRIVPLAINALQDPSPARKERAMRVLAKIGPDAAPAVPELVKILKSGDAKQKAEALFVLGSIGPKAETAVPAAIAALGDADSLVKGAAGYALGKIGPAAKEALPALKGLAASGDDLQRLSSIWAMLQIGVMDDDLKRTAVPLLANALSNEREFVRIEAAMSLGNLGKASTPALPQLEKALQDPSPDVRSAAAEAIQQIRG
jgi:HEAT repeat protein